MGLRNRSPVALLTVAAVLAGCTTTDPQQDHLEWTLTPAEGQMDLGGSIPFEIRIKSKANINADLELTAEPRPTGLIIDLPARVTSTVSRISGVLQTGPGFEVGDHTISFNVREAGSAYGEPKILDYRVMNPGGAPDFSLQVDTTEYTLQVEAAHTFGFRVDKLNGYTGTVTISLGGLPDDVIIVSGPTPPSLTLEAGVGSKGGTFVLNYLPIPPVTGQFNLLVSVTDGTITHHRTIVVTLPVSPSTPS